MDDIQFNHETLKTWAICCNTATHCCIEFTEDDVQKWAAELSEPIRQCYVTDQTLAERSKTLNISRSDVLATKLPDAGSTMSGDFGEILTYLSHALLENHRLIFGPKKWRLKQDRTKPAPHSDVVQFVLPSWPTASENDVVICSEVKTRATASKSNPIAKAIADCAKDRTSRLARTLIWLKERAIGEDLGDVKISHLDRFIFSYDYPKSTKRFQAVAVVCSSLISEELPDIPKEASSEYKLIIITVPNLRKIYTEVFEGVANSVVEEELEGQ